MNLLGRLALFFVVVPLLELVLLIQVGQVVGLLPTIMLVLFTGVAGAYLARAEGLRVLRQFQAEVASGRVPGQSLQDGIAVLVGGAFLLTPGILTDLAGFALLVPTTRRWIQARMRRSLEEQIRNGSIRTVVASRGGVWTAGFSASSGQPGAGPFGGRATDPFGRPVDGSGALGESRRTEGLDPANEIEVRVDGNERDDP